MFLAGVVPGILLAIAYVAAIWFMGRFTPGFVGGRLIEAESLMSWGEILSKTLPIVILIVVVLGGLYTGWTTPVEAGAAGSLIGIIIAGVRGRINLKSFWETVLETGHITAALLFLITAASMYARMLGLAGLPNELSNILAENQLGFFWIMLIYVVLMLFLGTILDLSLIHI